MRSVRFNINNPDYAGIGKFGIEGTNDEGVAADFYFSATLDGIPVVAETKFADNVADTAAYSDYGFALAVDASTLAIMTGVYNVKIIAKTVGASTVLNTYSQSFGFNPYGSTRVQSLNLTDSIDCINGEFTFTDATAYRTASDTVVLRAWTVVEPTVMGSPGSTITGTASYVKVAFSYVNVTYQVRLVSSITYTNASGGDITITETHQYSVEQNYFVDCDNNLCEIKQCLYDTLSSLNTQACRLGGFDKLDGNNRAKWFSLQQYLAGWHVANECQDATSRQAYYLKLKELLDCECKEDVSVRPFVPPDGTIQVQTAWATVATVFLNSFVNGPTPLRWRVDRDNRVHIVGYITIPNALSVGVSVDVTTGFIPASLLSGMTAINSPVFDTGGNPIGALRLETDSDLAFIPGSGYSGVIFGYVNMLIPLD